MDGWFTFPSIFKLIISSYVSHCKIKLLFRFINRMEKDTSNDNTAGDNSDEERKSGTSKDIKKRMDRYEERIKSGEAPAGDATRSDE